MVTLVLFVSYWFSRFPAHLSTGCLGFVVPVVWSPWYWMCSYHNSYHVYGYLVLVVSVQLSRLFGTGCLVTLVLDV